MSLRQRLLAVGLIALAATTTGVIIALAMSGPSGRGHGRSVPADSDRATMSTARAKPPPSAFAVGLRLLRLVDTSRTVDLANGGREPRTLTVYVRYPTIGAPSGTDLTGAPPARAYGPFPLVVFGHGFALTPASYSRMLQSWARAGYVVAAPVFPLENANAPNGPDESDLANQPADVRFVISRLLASSGASSSTLAGLIDPARIAVAGHSDGGDTALAVAYDPRFRDPRVRAAIILSGAEIPDVGPFGFPREGPPLLAVQGTADTVNPPSATNAFFEAAPRPKYLLSLLGAEHVAPYSVQQPQLTIVERVTLAFLDGYLKSRPGALEKLPSLGNVPDTASLLAER